MESNMRGWNWRWLGCAGLAMALVLAARPVHAANTCPWMTEATASGLLGAEATGNFTPGSPPQPADCVFTESAPGVTRTLTISVETSTDGAGRIRELLRDCHDAPDSMKAIGNEAQMCALLRPHGPRGEFVAGRVRDQVFSIAINTTMKNDPVLTPEELKNRMGIAAEQVAGNLF